VALAVGGEEADTTGCAEEAEDEEEQPDAHRAKPLDGEDPPVDDRLLALLLRFDDGHGPGGDGSRRTPENIEGEAGGGVAQVAQQGHGVLRVVLGSLMTVCVLRAAGLTDGAG
jgi:hypothetical protein